MLQKLDELASIYTILFAGEFNECCKNHALASVWLEDWTKFTDIHNKSKHYLREFSILYIYIFI